jgi:hypothetical protein
MNAVEQLIQALQCSHKEAYDDLYELILLAQEYEAGRYNSVTRFEVIDHSQELLGRCYVKHKCRVEASLQDDTRTLKIFVNDRV